MGSQKVQTGSPVASILQGCSHRHRRVGHRAIHHLTFAHVLGGQAAPRRRVRVRDAVLLGERHGTPRPRLIEDRDTILDNLGSLGLLMIQLLLLEELLLVAIVLIHYYLRNACGRFHLLWVVILLDASIVLSHHIVRFHGIAGRRALG